jgi:hypothetical protein
MLYLSILRTGVGVIDQSERGRFQKISLSQLCDYSDERFLERAVRQLVWNFSAQTDRPVDRFIFAITILNYAREIFVLDLRFTALYCKCCYNMMHFYTQTRSVAVK